MLADIPFPLIVFFVATVLLTFGLFAFLLYKSGSGGKKTAIFSTILLFWIILQSSLALNGVFYQNLEALPPAIVLWGIFPTVLLLLFILFSEKGRNFMDGLNPIWLYFFHIVRLPVEWTLYELFMFGKVPVLMTFAGRNFDIFAGLTAPLIAFGVYKNALSKWILSVWNGLCLCLLANIVISAALSAPSPLQQLAFEQPNVAILYFPFNLLPTFIVPLVLFAHLASLRFLFKTKTNL